MHVYLSDSNKGNLLTYLNKCILSGYFYSASSSPLPRRSRHSTDTVSEFHAEALQATEGLVQGPYVAARAGFKPATLPSFIHPEHFYSASSRELLRGAPDSSTAKKSSLKLRKKRR